MKKLDAGILIREVQECDLLKLLELYEYLGDNPVPDRLEEVLPLWREILQSSYYHIWVAEKDDKLLSSCTLLIVPNLTHGQRPYALVENVVTHPDFRGQGLGTAVLDAAREFATREDCYKIMLLTGSKKESTHRFYQNAGYRSDIKTGYCQKIEDKRNL